MSLYRDILLYIKQQQKKPPVRELYFVKAFRKSSLVKPESRVARQGNRDYWMITGSNEQLWIRFLSISRLMRTYRAVLSSFLRCGAYWPLCCGKTKGEHRPKSQLWAYHNKSEIRTQIKCLKVRQYQYYASFWKIFLWITYNSKKSSKL